MTLSTDICIIGDVDPEFLFSTALVAVCLAAHEPERIATAKVDRDGPSKWSDYDTISTTCGQGLAAWTWVKYRADGAPLRAMDEYDTEELGADEDGVADTWFIGPACQALINIDTAYSYKGRDNAGCGTLHARVITMVHDEVAKLGCTIKWKNEFTGEWFDGLDGLDSLEDGGVAATNWFKSDVMPAIAAFISNGSTLAIEA